MCGEESCDEEERTEIIADNGTGHCAKTDEGICGGGADYEAGFEDCGADGAIEVCEF